MNDLKKYYDKTVKIVCNDGSYHGRIIDYIYPEDNEPEGHESLIVETNDGQIIEFIDDDVESIIIL